MRKHLMMRVVRHLSLVTFGLFICNALGCADTQNWWNETFGPKQSEPSAEATDAEKEKRDGVKIAREEGGETTPAATGPSQTADSEKAPDDIEDRIRQYVQQFPEQHDTAPAGDQPQPNASTPSSPGSSNAPASVTPPSSPPEPTRTAAAEPPASQTPAPPVLRNVSVDDDETPDATPVQPVAVEPSVNRGTQLTGAPREMGLHAQIAEMERRVNEQPNDAESQLRLRMLYLATGQDEKASAPVSGVSKEMADMLSSLIDVVEASRMAASHPDTQADALLDAVDAYRDQIKRHADLKVPTVALCTAADSFGVYKPYPPDDLIAGKTTRVVVYCEIGNFSSQKTPEGTYRTRLASQVEVLDADGRSVATLSRKQFEDLSRNQREDFFLGEVVELPASLDPGEYTLRVLIEDRGSGRFSSGSTKFMLRPSAS